MIVGNITLEKVREYIYLDQFIHMKGNFKTRNIPRINSMAGILEIPIQHASKSEEKSVEPVCSPRSDLSL